MRIDSFQIGERIHVPNADGPKDSGALYSTVQYIGQNVVLLQSEDGEEFLVPADRDDFARYQTPDDIKALGDDLVSAIENACWVDGGQANLTRPTPHMVAAVLNWKDAHRV